MTAEDRSHGWILPRVEFGEYVPFTVTWDDYDKLLDPPICFVVSSDAGVLEFKFHPDTMRLVEVILVAAPAIRSSNESMGPVHPCDQGWGLDSIPSGESPVVSEISTVVGYRDCIYVIMDDRTPDCWIGSTPLFIGLSKEGKAMVLRLDWDRTSRALVLGGDSGPRQSPL